MCITKDPVLGGEDLQLQLSAKYFSPKMSILLKYEQVNIWLNNWIFCKCLYIWRCGALRVQVLFVLHYFMVTRSEKFKLPWRIL